MAQKIQVLLLDDLDGSAACETVKFGFDGTDYEIDLSSGNASDMRNTLAEYVEHARKIGNTGRRRTPVTTLNTTEIRNWARENGYDIKDRGRVPADVVAKYQAAMGQ
jgi:hypothetical protein